MSSNDTPHVEAQASPNPATTNWVPVGPGPMPDFRYRGDFVAATNYYDGDITIYNGIAYLCVAPTSTAPVSWALLPVTTTPGCHVSRSTNQTIPTGVETVLTFDSERFDTDNIHDTVTNTSRLTCRTAGKYVVTATAAFAQAAGGVQRYVFPRLNGTGSLGYFKTAVMASSPAVSGAQVVDLVAGDYLELLAYQDSGGNLDVLSGGVGPTGQWSPEFSMMKIEGAAGPTGPQGVPGTPAATAPGYGTTLPASPANGQETIFVDSTTNPSYQWRFRYNATSTSAYKWEFIGGSPVSSSVDALESTTSTTYVAIATPGPSITLPRPGDYLISLGVDVSAAPSDIARISYDIGATAANDNDSITFNNASTAVMGSTIYCSRLMSRTGFTAVALVMKYKSLNGGNSQFRRRSMSVWPIRVS